MKTKLMLFFSLISMHAFGFMVEESLEKQEKSKHYEHFFKACLHHSKGEHKEAHEVYNKMFLNRTPEACDKSYIKLLFDSHNFGKVLKKTEKKFSSDSNMQMLRAQSFLMIGNNASAEPILKKIAHDKPNDLGATYQYTVCLMRQNKTQDALKTLNSFLDENTQSPQHAMLYLLKSKNFLMQNDSKKALDAINKSLEIYPRFSESIRLKSILLQQMDKVEEAISSFKDYLNLVNNPEAEQQLLNMMIRHKKYSLLSEQIKKSRITSADFFHTLGNGLISLQEKQTAHDAFSKACSINPNHTKSWIAQIDLIDKQEKKEELEAILTAWIKASSQRSEVIKMLAELHQKHFSTKEMIQYLAQLHEKEISTAETLSFLVDLYYENENYQKGLDTVEQLFSFTLHPPVHATVLFNKAYAHWMLNNREECIPSLEKALALNPNHDASANLLALCYLEENQQLEKADLLINLALEKQPENKTFMKTKEQVTLKLEQEEIKQKEYEQYAQNRTSKIKTEICKQKKLHSL